MAAICFYFQVHQPYRLRQYGFFDIGENPFYEDEKANREILRKVASKCYLPMNALLLELIEEYADRFCITFSLSGMVLEQFEAYAPEVIDSYQKLAATGCVEFLAETYNHSLAFLYSHKEFEKQVEQHCSKIKQLFGQTPQALRNTELIYNNELAKVAEGMGFTTILAEGADHILSWRSPNYIYTPPESDTIRLLLRNYPLSDDIAFMFSDKCWKEYPLTAEKFVSWLMSAEGDLINLFMDYETFGEHQWEDTGIFSFMRSLPEKIFATNNFSFLTISQAAETFTPIATLDMPQYVSWADQERDLTAWLGNDMQKDAFQTIYDLASNIHESKCANLLATWRKLQTSDHFYYMCTKWFSDGDVHRYFNPYATPYEAYITFMNVLADLSLRALALNNEHKKECLTVL